MRVNSPSPLSWNPEDSDRRRVELLDEDGEKGKKRGDIYSTIFSTSFF